MARALRAGAVLTLGCSALNLAPEGPRLCQGGAAAYEAVQHSPAECTVYCVPEGQCELMAQTGKLKGYGITAQGNCQRRGFTEAAELGNVSMRMVRWLKTLTGPCRGMTVAKKFHKPAAAPGEPAAAPGTPGEPAAAPGESGPPAPVQGGATCGYEHVAYRGINPAYPGVCSLFCVPDGLCNGQAIAGQLGYLGLTGPGSCQEGGYTVLAALGAVAQKTEAYVKSLRGICAGMTIAKYQKPPAEEPPAEQGRGAPCGWGRTAYEAIAAHNPGMCSVYCIPEGVCEGQVQGGSMGHLGITGQGNCRARGFTERMQYATSWAKHVQGPCRGMEVMHYQRPGLMEQKSAPEQGICGKEKKAFEAISRLYPNVCQLFCVPEGDCEGQVIMGKLGALGITGEGNCKKRGFTAARAVGIMSSNTAEWVKAQHGSCKGITIQQFHRPGVSAVP